MSVCKAVASANVTPGGRSAIYCVHLPTIPTPTPTTPCAIAVAFAGDAAHTLDPILAQGARMRVEDAAHLYAVLEKEQADTKTQTQTQQQPHPLAPALADFERRRLEKVSRLHLASNLAQTIGHMENSQLVRMRNWVISLVPRRLTGWVFDAVLRWLG